MSQVNSTRAETVAPAGDDLRLMEGIRAGDRDSFERLYNRYSPRVLAFCLRSLRDRAEAEDLVVEIFWELWRRQDRYDEARSSPFTYLMKVTRSRLVDRLRARQSRQSRAIASPGNEDPAGSTAMMGSGPLEQLADQESSDRLRQAMNRLGADQRQALEMAYFDAMSYSEVAHALGQPLGTVKSRIRQALNYLRQMLGKPES